MVQGTGIQNERRRNATWTTKAGGIVRNLLNPFIKPGQVCNTNYSNKAMWLICWPILQVLFVFQKARQIMNQPLKDIILVLDILNWKGIRVLSFNKLNKNKTYMQHLSSQKSLNAFHMTQGQIQVPKWGESTAIDSQKRFLKFPRKSRPVFQVCLALTILNYL